MKIQSALAAVERELEAQTALVPGSLGEVCRYATSGGGRLRVALLLCAAQRCDERAVQAATALELLHAATLLQDDIFDAGHMRRGRVAAHLQFGKAHAILASDWLLIRALELAAGVHAHFFGSLAQAAKGMAETEAEELSPIRLASFDEARQSAYAIARGKTAGLFGTALLAAALLRGEDLSRCQAWEQLGLELGVTYQMLDDCVDVYAQGKLAGKDVDHDLNAGRTTLPVLLGAAVLQSQGEPISLEVLQSGHLHPVQMEALHTAMQAAAVKQELLSSIDRRLAAHQQQAMGAGLPAPVMEAWTPEIRDKLTMCSFLPGGPSTSVRGSQASQLPETSSIFLA